MSKNTIRFSTLHPDGTESNVRYIDSILKCPFLIIMSEHYRDDNTCKCDDPEHRRLMIQEWGYTEADFAEIPLRKKS